MLRTLKGIFDSRTSGENIVIAIQRLYDGASEINPGDDPHIRLIKTAFSRLRSGNLILRKGLAEDQLAARAHALSAIPACLPEGHNSRLLALHLLRDERPDIWQAFPEFEAESASLYYRLEREVIGGTTLLALYKAQNPILQVVDLEPLAYDALLAIFGTFEKDHVGRSRLANSINSRGEGPSAKDEAIAQQALASKAGTQVERNAAGTIQETSETKAQKNAREAEHDGGEEKAVTPLVGSSDRLLLRCPRCNLAYEVEKSSMRASVECYSCSFVWAPNAYKTNISMVGGSYYSSSKIVTCSWCNQAHSISPKEQNAACSTCGVQLNGTVS